MTIGIFEIHTAQPLVPKPSAFEIDKAIEDRKGSNQVLIKFQQKWVKHEVEQFVLEAISLFIHFE